MTVRAQHRRAEIAARLALLVIVLVVPAAILGYHFGLRPALADVRVIDIVARAPEAGGFDPEAIRVAAGETVRLRFSAPDVTHGIAIGPGLGIDLGHIDPGQVREARVTFDRPGRYTFYCNTWCSVSHWRMRGTIEVYDPARPAGPPPAESADPVVESLVRGGVDIDAPHIAPAVPRRPVDVARGRAIVTRPGQTLTTPVMDVAWRRTRSPAQAWAALVAEGLAHEDAWDVVGHAWLSGRDDRELAGAARLFAKNCAACHGERGDGRGPAAATIPGVPRHDGVRKGPAAFSDPGTMLGAASRIYYGKLRRGGMGTGMPSFGPVFTPDETWMLVDYLWTFPLAARESEAAALKWSRRRVQP